MRFLLVLIILLPGCMAGSHREVRPDGSSVTVRFVSVGGHRKVEELVYGPLHIKGGSSDETAAIEAAVKGAVRAVLP